MDMEYLNMVKQSFSTPNYYFSYTYDLTHSIQRLHDVSTSITSFLNVSSLFMFIYRNKIHKYI